MGTFSAKWARSSRFEHTRLTYRHMGRDFRLTGSPEDVVKKLLV